MNKDEMIKDMEQILDKEFSYAMKCIPYRYGVEEYAVSAKEMATELYNAGYHKIADDEFVIKKSEYEALKKDYAEWKDEYDHNCLLRLEVFELEKQLAQAKQETAEKIYHKIKVETLCEDMTEDRPQTLYRFTAFDIMKMARKIVEEFGVVFQDGHTSIGV